MCVNYARFYKSGLMVDLWYLQCDVMAREGLRTLVAGRRILTTNEYQEFEVLIVHQTVPAHFIHSTRFHEIT